MKKSFFQISKKNFIGQTLINKLSMITNISKSFNKKMYFKKNFCLPSNKISLFQKSPMRFFSEEEQQDKKEKVIEAEVAQDPEIKQTNTTNQLFKAETKKLLDIVTHSLYTDKEVFLRELLSNCSDALEKQRYLETTGKLTMTGDPFYISIMTNEKNKTITIFDSGVGMTREEMIENLGTIAKSGTQNFLKEIKDTSNTPTDNLIGQFGVGFYSSFIVGDQVEVISKIQTSQKGAHWVSDGSGEYQISDVDNTSFSRGTKIIIHLKPECRDFSRGSEVIKVVKKYSNFISYSIKVNGEKVNEVQAIWYRNKKDITKEEYQRFFEAVNNESKLPYKYMLHFSSDTPLDIKSIIYIPQNNSEKFGIQEEFAGLSLFSRKILIKQKCIELLPRFLRFCKGVVDCSDIPLSISRENYQDSSLIFKLKTVITRRIIKKLEDELKANTDEYDTWYEDFKNFLKEGILGEREYQEGLFRIIRFKCSLTGVKQSISIEDYISKMMKNQNKIYYYCSTTDKSSIEDNVHVQQFSGTELPILLTVDSVDEMIFRQINQYKDFKFLNIENESDDFIDKIRSEKGETLNKLPESDISPYTLWLKNELEPHISKVTLSKRLTDIPLIITSETSANMKQLYSVMNMDPQMALRNLTLEINPSHDAIVHLNELRKSDSKTASLILKLIFDAGLAQSNLGILHKDFSKRTFNIAQQFINLKLNSNEKTTEGENLKVERKLNEEENADKKDDSNNNMDKFESLKIK